MKKIIFLILIALSSCISIQRYEKIKIAGSDTMYKLLEILSAVYMKNNPNISIYITGGGTEYGFQALENGQADIAMASRNIQSDELKIIIDKFNSIGVSHLIAKDAIVIYVNSNNPIEDLSIEDLNKIYLCKINNWKDFGWKDQEILAYRRMSTSGTYHYFKSHILNGEDYCKNIIAIQNHETLISLIEQNENSIGFGGLGNHSDAKPIKVNNIYPLTENIKKDKYPLTRYLQLFTISEPKGYVRDFINWIMSSEGQNIIKNFGYVGIL